VRLLLGLCQHAAHVVYIAFGHADSAAAALHPFALRPQIAVVTEPCACAAAAHSSLHLASCPVHFLALWQACQHKHASVRLRQALAADPVALCPVKAQLLLL